MVFFQLGLTRTRDFKRTIAVCSVFGGELTSLFQTSGPENLTLIAVRLEKQHPGPVDDLKMPKNNAPSVGLQNEDLLLGKVDPAVGVREVLLQSALVSRGLPRPQTATTDR